MLLRSGSQRAPTEMRASASGGWVTTNERGSSGERWSERGCFLQAAVSVADKLVWGEQTKQEKGKMGRALRRAGSDRVVHKIEEAARGKQG